MERKIIIRLIAFNLILSSFIILDLYIPGRESEVKELGSFYSSTTYTGTSRTPIMETKGIVEFLDGEYYRIGKLPEKDYRKGQKIKIIKSLIMNNVNEVIIWDNGWKKIKVGVFSNISLYCLLAISILCSALNIFYRNKSLNILLIASMMYLAVISMVYICYF